MAANVGGTPSIATLQGLVNSVTSALAATGGAPAAAGGGAAPAAGGAAAPAAGAQAATGGIVTGGGTTPTTVGTFTTQSGRQVTLTQLGGQHTMTPASGTAEVVNVSGKLIRFDATGKQTSAFDQVLSQRYHVTLDRSSGISNGLANLSKVFAAGQQRVRDMSDALAEDASVTGSIDPVALQKMSMESSTAQQMSQMELKIYESMKETVQAWLQR